MKHSDIHKIHSQNSGPGSKPAGAAPGRAAATIRNIPAPLPGVDIRAPAEQSAPHPRARARRGSLSPTCFQQGSGNRTDHEISSETGLLIWRLLAGRS